MATIVLDACAVIAYLRGEPGEEIVAEALADPSTTCIAHKINLLEVYYDVLRQKGEQEATKVLEYLRGDGLETSSEFRWSYLQKIGTLKVREKLSLADCFGFVLANQIGAVFLTSDHHEFDRLLDRYPEAIRFIR